MIAPSSKAAAAQLKKLAPAFLYAAHQAAFSLVEVTLAIGIVAIAIIPVFGLIPTGLNTFHKAIDTSVGSQIAQRVINEAQQTDFKTLTSGTTTRFVQISGSSALRYFDDQGSELALTATASAIYQARVVIAPIMTVPQTTGTTSNVNLASVIIQVVNNPRQVTLPADPTSLLWSGTNTYNIPVSTYSAIVANNQ